MQYRGQHVQEGMLGEKCPGEVHQIREYPVVGVGPEGGKFKAVAGLFFFLAAEVDSLMAFQRVVLE